MPLSTLETVLLPVASAFIGASVRGIWMKKTTVSRERCDLIQVNIKDHLDRIENKLDKLNGNKRRQEEN